MPKKKSNNKNKTPKTVVQTLPKKSPISNSSPDSYKVNTPVWRIKSIDDTSRWGWQSIGQDNWQSHILPALQSYESMTWNAIMTASKGRGKGTKNHFIPKDRIIKEAQDRLEALKMDDIDEIFSLRVSGEKRIFGILEDRVFRILWFDMNHEICPSKKKHT